MRRFKIKDMIGGWFIGDFEPSVLRTPDFEVCFKQHKKGEDWPRHYHKEATEYNLLLRGQMTINGQLFKAGHGFIIEPGEVSKPVFLTDCELIIVKTPSVPGDKYEV